MRVGTGYDIHPFDPARPLVLGGVTIEGGPGLGGHSDADVLLHAVIDALLGAAGLGDIGQQFPPTDPAYAGVDSADLLTEAVALVREAGLRVESVDSTVVAEQPRLAPHVHLMRERIAHIVGLPVDRVNVKAKTNEGLGPIGRGEGIAAMAVALLAEAGR
jgi:2-C-methyl-D-erythritol 2,4-cyclodiphosphate synthase